MRTIMTAFTIAMTVSVAVVGAVVVVCLGVVWLLPQNAPDEGHEPPVATAGVQSVESVA